MAHPLESEVVSTKAPVADRSSPCERYFIELLGEADIRVNGERPWDMHIHDKDLPRKVLANGSLALGEAYMAGGWDCERLDQFFYKMLSAKLDKRVGSSLRAAWIALRAKFTNPQTGRRAYTVGKHHYDLGNNFFEKMLDKRMTYSCAYWEEAETLDDAQEAKLDLICRKIGLKSGQSVLDIGCGWGSFAGFAAERYGAHVVGVTVSKEQAQWANRRLAALPVEIRTQDYRQVSETFDHVISAGMFEHVGYKNYHTFMKVVAGCLKDEGCFLLHTIGRNTSYTTVEPWTEKYIFPNSMLPSPKQVTDAAEGLFTLRDWHSFGQDYDPTLMAWHANFENNWERLSRGLSETFYRMWRYYLLACAGAFRADDNQLWQIVFTKPGNKSRYKSIR